MKAGFRPRFEELFTANHERLFRYLDRQCGEPELARDVVQDTFLRLYRRASMPEHPEAWLISVAMNLFRNARLQRSRRARLLTGERGTHAAGDPVASPEQPIETERTRARVRSALDRLPDRDRQLLLLRAEGYRYREIAEALAINETSIGTLLARARQQFRAVYEEAARAS